MTGLMSDIGAGYDLVIGEYQRLQRDDFGNELLKYISLTQDRKGFIPTQDPSLQDDFLRRFTDDKTTVIKMWINYFVAMRRAVDKIEGIDREPKSTEQIRRPVILETSVIVEDEDLPF